VDAVAYLPYLGLFAAGLAAGFINTVAGGGSLLALPALIHFAGLPVHVANGTNRVAVVLQSAAGARAFAQQGRLDRGLVLPTLLPTLLGAVVGAGAATALSPALLEPVLYVMLGIMAVVLLFRPSVLAPTDEERRPVGAAAAVGLFLAGLYGGFLQAGVGFVLLAVLGGLVRLDPVRANALKLVLILLFGLASLAIFLAAGQVSWLPGVVLAAGSMLGARLAVSFALRVPARALRILLLVAVTASAVAAYLR
jgi:uncharacterized membrane protein YfcA